MAEDQKKGNGTADSGKSGGEEQKWHYHDLQESLEGVLKGHKDDIIERGRLNAAKKVLDTLEDSHFTDPNHRKKIQDALAAELKEVNGRLEKFPETIKGMEHAKSDPAAIARAMERATRAEDFSGDKSQLKTAEADVKATLNKMAGKAGIEGLAPQASAEHTAALQVLRDTETNLKDHLQAHLPNKTDVAALQGKGKEAAVKALQEQLEAVEKNADYKTYHELSKKSSDFVQADKKLHEVRADVVQSLGMEGESISQVKKKIGENLKNLRDKTNLPDGKVNPDFATELEHFESKKKLLTDAEKTFSNAKKALGNDAPTLGNLHQQHPEFQLTQQEIKRTEALYDKVASHAKTASDLKPKAAAAGTIDSVLTADARLVEKIKAAESGFGKTVGEEFQASASKAGKQAYEGLEKGAWTRNFKNIPAKWHASTTGGKLGIAAGTVALGVIGGLGAKKVIEGIKGGTDKETGEETEPSLGKTLAGVAVGGGSLLGLNRVLSHNVWPGKA